MTRMGIGVDNLVLRKESNLILRLTAVMLTVLFLFGQVFSDTHAHAHDHGHDHEPLHNACEVCILAVHNEVESGELSDENSNDTVFPLFGPDLTLQFSLKATKIHLAVTQINVFDPPPVPCLELDTARAPPH